MKKKPALILCAALLACQALLAQATPASLTMRMATRSGPGTKYTEELGALPIETPITLIYQVMNGPTPWGMVEFSTGGRKYRAYTGMKRIQPFAPLPFTEEEMVEYTLSEASPVYYGPGEDYATRKESLGIGRIVRVFGWENYYLLIEYKPGDQWVRGYVPEHCIPEYYVPRGYMAE